jgi:transposase-like protein
MISRRLTNAQKAEIVEAYKAGQNTNDIAHKYRCSTNTIVRTVKTLLSDIEYISLKEKRSKINNKKIGFSSNENKQEKPKELSGSDDFNCEKNKVNEEDQSKKIDEDIFSPKNEKIVSLCLDDSDDESSSDLQSNTNHLTDKNNNDFDQNFEEIAPLISNFDFDKDKQISNFEIHTYESLPESVYMIVDKKVELDLHPISDLPEWSFLPENELKRNAILLFPNQRSAKRSCSRNQRVIKVPNTCVFEISKSYLVSKGITRLILEDLLISLDN